MTTLSAKVPQATGFVATLLAIVASAPLQAFAFREPVLREVESYCGTSMTQELATRSWEDLARDSRFLDALYPLMFARDQIILDGTRAVAGQVLDITTAGPKCLAFGMNFDDRIGIVIVILVFARNGALWFQAFPNLGGSLLGVRDLDGDGSVEVLTVRRLATSTDEVNGVSWPTVYKFKTDRFVEASAECPIAYRKYIEQLDERLQEVEAFDPADMAPHFAGSLAKAGEWNSLRRADLMTGKYCAQQVLGDRKAGYEQAAEWAKAADHHLRCNAVSILRGIGDSDSNKLLEKLSHDEHFYVSYLAREALEKSQPLD